MRALAFTLGAILFATSAVSQSVEVRAGRHDGFTRLVVDLPNRMEIDIEQNTKEAAISFPGQRLTFDTSRVFRRISGERVLEIRSDAENSSLQVRFGCRCEISSFWHGKSLLVLDVRESSAFPQTPNLDREYSEPIEVEATERRRLTLQQNSGSFAAALANTQFQMATPDKQEPEIPFEKPSLDEAPVNDEVILKARDQLIKQIGRAASQGLLEPRSTLKPPQPQPAPAVSSPVEETQIESQIDPRTQVNLKAQSSIDRDFLAALENSVGSHLGANCFQNEMIDVGAWGSEETFSKQVGQLRLSLMGEFDELNNEAAVRLAQLYLHYGFGPEALLTLELVDEETEQTAVLRTLAAVMNDGHATQNSALADQLSCEGSSALWSVLSFDPLPSHIPIKTDAVLRAFDALPSHLRSHLGPFLSRRFLDAGYQEAADKVLRILNRSTTTQSPDAQLVEAEINLSEGKETEAASAMQDVVDASAEPSAEALVQLIDATIQSGQAVSFDHAMLAGSYAVQNRGEPLENELNRVYLIGLSASGTFEQAYDEYARLSSNFPPGTLTVVDSEMVAQLTRHSDDITFLKYAMINHTLHEETLLPSVANAAANRLLDIGFPKQARKFLMTDVAGDAGLERKTLRAKISLAQGHANQAEADIVGLDGKTADLLRAQARSMMGDHDTAAILYESSGEAHKALRQAWLAENWQRVIESKDTVRADFAALVGLEKDNTNNSLDADSDQKSERILAQNQELIQQSLAARETVASILKESPSP